MKIKIPVPEELIQSEKKFLHDFHQFLNNYPAENEDIELISDSILQLDDLFMIINALLGKNYLDMGVTPTTSEIQILRYGEKLEENIKKRGSNKISLPVSFLKDVTIVDTPGTNAVLREHEALTTDFIPKSDLVLFVTSVDRPFPESERKFLEIIKEWGKKIVIILNKKDILENENELEEIQQFIHLNLSKLLDIEPNIYFLSAKKALEEKLSRGTSTEDLADIEEFISRTLNSKDRIRLKLLNPLGVVERLVKKYASNLNEKIVNIAQDLQLLDDIERQLTLFKEDMARSFKFRYSEIDNSLLQYEKRGLEFFDDTFRIGRILDLINKERIQAEYKKKVVKNLNSEIDTKVNDLIDWLVDEDLKQWHEITQKIESQSAHFEERIIAGKEKQRVRFERKKIIETVKRETQRLIEQFNKEDEAKKIAEDAQMAVAASAAIEAGALGLGTLVTILATSASADLTGILLAGFTATLGLFILPAKKNQARRLFSKSIIELRKHLSESLTEEFNKQIDLVNEKIRTTISPYSRFIRAENDKFLNYQRTIEEIKIEKTRLEKRINRI
jgi:GTP-binding protein EngB required for normal cell division